MKAREAVSRELARSEVPVLLHEAPAYCSWEISRATNSDTNAADMVEKLQFVHEHHAEVKAALELDINNDNVGRMADWLAGNGFAEASGAGSP